MSAPTPRLRSYQFDRTLTFGLLVSIMIQTAGGLIWAGAAEARLSAIEMQMAYSSDVSERLARLEGQTDHMAQSLSRIERTLSEND